MIAENPIIQEWTKMIVTSLLTGMLTSVAWYVGIVDRMITQEQATRLVATESPYLEDRKLLIQTLESLQETSAENRDAVGDLRVEIASLNATLKTLD